MVAAGGNQLMGGRMTELENLERRIYELTQFIGADSRALRSAFTSQADKAHLRRAVDLRAEQRRRLRGLLASLPRSEQNAPDYKPAGGIESPRRT